MVLGMASKDPAIAGVRPEGQEPAPQLMLDVDRAKAQALGIDMADLNDTLQSALGVAYINDFVREGRILRVQMQAEARNAREHRQHPATAGAQRQGRHGAAVGNLHGALGRWCAQAGPLQRPARR